MPITAAHTRRSSSRTGSTTGTSPRPAGRSVTVSTTLRWKSTWATLRKEIRHIWGPWEQLASPQLRAILFECIDVFYNRQRHQPASIAAPCRGLCIPQNAA